MCSWPIMPTPMTPTSSATTPSSTLRPAGCCWPRRGKAVAAATAPSTAADPQISLNASRGGEGLGREVVGRHDLDARVPGPDRSGQRAVRLHHYVAGAAQVEGEVV